LPDSIGNFTALQDLDLSYNQFESLPGTLRNLTDHIVLLNLKSNQDLLQMGEGNTLGQNELRAIFGDRVVLSAGRAAPIELVTNEAV
jgi:Leucine-rich repeat (LRR) protein